MGFARVPNGTGNFVIQQPTYHANNNTVGIAELLASQNQMLIYPNPANDKMIIQLLKPEENGLKIYNSLGQLMDENTTIANQYNIQTSRLHGGIYFVKAGNMTKSFIVQH
jgi:hypothetical protein